MLCHLLIWLKIILLLRLRNLELGRLFRRVLGRLLAGLVLGRLLAGRVLGRLLAGLVLGRLLAGRVLGRLLAGRVLGRLLGRRCLLLNLLWITGWSLMSLLSMSLLLRL